MSSPSPSADPVSDLAVEVRREVAAPRERLFRLLTDIEAVAGLGPEHVEAWWDGGSRPPDDAMLGAGFTGRNVRGGREWSMPCRVIAYEPPARFGWVVGDPDQPTATWTYDLTETGAATTVVQRFRHGPGWSYLRGACERHPDRAEEFTAGRAKELEANMTAVLASVEERLAAQRLA